MRINLNGTWQFKEYPQSARRMRDLDGGDWIPTNAPHSIYAALIRAGRIEASDLFARPEQYLGVSRVPWIFRQQFEVTDAITGADRVDLVCEGLDTVAQVWLNEKLIARTDNMFLSHRLDVTGILKPGANTLLIKFDSPLETADRRADRCGKLNTLWGMPQRTWLRKAQYQFGSPFGPALPGCGIHRPIYLESVTAARLEDVHVRTVDCNEQFADLRVAVELDVPGKTQSDLACQLEIARGGFSIRHSFVFDRHDKQSALIRIDNPDLWWPAGCGDPALYTLTARLLSGGREVDRAEVHFGIRTLQFNGEAESGTGPVRFIVNGRPVFIQGAFWFPTDLFATPRAPDETERRLRDFLDSHGNLLRIWAAGPGEDDEFYRLCDRLGLLVWQDFPFAEAYYPERSWFLDAVRNETAPTIRRLRNHPSLALWCGSDSIDYLHRSGRLGGGRKFYGKDIYHKLLPSLVRSLDPDRDYIPTTPSVDKKSKSTRTIAEPLIHINSQTPPTGFVAAADCPALPNLDTLRSLLPALPAADDPAMQTLVFKTTDLPDLLHDCIRQFGLPRTAEDLLFQSQLLQARRFKQVLESCRGNQAQCGGMIWKSWNEYWPAVGGGAWDAQHHPRALAWYWKRFAAPVSAFLPGEPADWTHAVVINDGQALLTAILKVQLMTLDGTLLDRHEAPLTVAPLASASIKLPRELLSPAQPENAFLQLEIESPARVFRNLYLFRPDREVCWHPMNLNVCMEPIGPREWKLTLQSPALVKDLIIIPPQSAQLSDNAFDLLPNEPAEIQIRFEQPAPPLPTPVRFRSSAFRPLDTG